MRRKPRKALCHCTQHVDREIVKVVERPVEVEKIVEKVVEKPVEVEKVVERIVERQVEVEKIVEVCALALPRAVSARQSARVCR